VTLQQKYKAYTFAVRSRSDGWAMYLRKLWELFGIMIWVDQFHTALWVA